MAGAGIMALFYLSAQAATASLWLLGQPQERECCQMKLRYFAHSMPERSIIWRLWRDSIFRKMQSRGIISFHLTFILFSRNERSIQDSLAATQFPLEPKMSAKFLKTCICSWYGKSPKSDLLIRFDIDIHFSLHFSQVSSCQNAVSPFQSSGQIVWKKTVQKLRDRKNEL